MKIKINDILFPILIGLEIFDLLILNGSNAFYLRSLLGIIYSLLIPGVLIITILKIRNNNLWEYITYSVGLSIVYIMFGGLAINWVLPIFGITKPLTSGPIIICVNISILLMILLSYIRNRSLNLKIKLPIFSFVDSLYLLTAFFFPVISVFGATLINNGVTNALTLVNLSMMTVYIFTITLWKKINTNVYALSLFLISLSVLLILSFRGNHIIGSDIMDEYKMFNLTYEHGAWIRNYIQHAYYSCLSITVLPTVLSHLIGIHNEFIFKFVMQLIFSVIPIIIFNIMRKFVDDRFAFFGSIIFISFPTFINAMAMHIRQEVGFIFFALCISLFFNSLISVIKKKIILFLFCIGMVVSHYSTTYVALLVLFPTYLTYTIFRNIKKLKLKTEKPKAAISFHKNYPQNIGLWFIFTICISTFIWYSQINNNSSNILNYVNNIVNNFDSILTADIRREGSSIFDQFSYSYTQVDQEKLLQEYIQNVREATLFKPGYYPSHFYENYNPKIGLPEYLPLNVTPDEQYNYFLSQETIKKIHKALTIVGLLYLAFLTLKGQNRNIEYTFLCFACFSSLLVFMILPNLSLDYDLLRAYQQFLIVLAYPSILGALVIFKPIPKLLSGLGISFAVAIYFAIYSNLLPQIIGGFEPTIQLNNYGDTYNKYYLFTEEIYSSKWLDKSRSNKKTVYIDAFGNRKINAFIESTVHGKHDTIPENILIDSYVTLDYANKVKIVTYGQIRGNKLTYNYPSEFVNTTKNKIYSNSKSEIYN